MGMGPFYCFCGVSSCDYVLDIPALGKHELSLTTCRNFSCYIAHWMQ